MDRGKFTKGDEIVDYWGYLKSIDWYEPWLIALILVHIGTIITAICTRNHSLVQMILFLVLLLLVFFSETINEFGARYWKSFSREQYFDSNGLFISTVFSIPILLNCMIMVGHWLYNSTILMAKLKAAQLREERKNRLLNSEKSESVLNSESRSNSECQSNSE